MVNGGAHTMMAWLSPSYPTGAFSYSHGLEYAIHSGDVTDADSLQNWLLDVLEFGAGRNDAILLAAAYNAGPTEDLAAIADLATALSASAERHLETTAQGAAFVKVTNAVAGLNLPDMPLPVALGAAARTHKIPLNEILPLYLHSFAANLIGAAVRFVPLGQTEGQVVLSNLFQLIDKVAENATAQGLDDLGSICFLGDMAAMKHEDMTTRIFRT